MTNGPRPNIWLSQMTQSFHRRFWTTQKFSIDGFWGYYIQKYSARSALVENLEYVNDPACLMCNSGWRQECFLWCVNETENVHSHSFFVESKFPLVADIFSYFYSSIFIISVYVGPSNLIFISYIFEVCLLYMPVVSLKAGIIARLIIL